MEDIKKESRFRYQGGEGGGIWSKKGSNKNNLFLLTQQKSHKEILIWPVFVYRKSWGPVQCLVRKKWFFFHEFYHYYMLFFPYLGCLTVVWWKCLTMWTVTQALFRPLSTLTTTIQVSNYHCCRHIVMVGECDWSLHFTTEIFRAAIICC